MGAFARALVNTRDGFPVYVCVCVYKREMCFIDTHTQEARERAPANEPPVAARN